ncbi:hypothetical protein [uncultured Tateyamaria sp.]|uniref:hypothetical protein n=1 Tax=uncultured Tateyamaria sp. TaxID=455651 RepID=UPI00261EFD77|nr:hypothetical protein [uncultured Tateyamaria sp.]
MGFPADYAKAMEKQFGFQVMWPPNRTVKIGDYGTIHGGKGKGGAFTKLGNIARDFDIPFETENSARVEVESLQSDGVSIVNATADGGGKVEGVDFAVQLSVNFEKKNSMVYNGSGMMVRSMTNIGSIGTKLAQKLAAGTWKKNYLVVTDVHETEGMTVLLCQTKNTQVTLGGSAALSTGNIGKASANVEVISNKSAVANYIASTPTTPLLKARAINKHGMKLQTDMLDSGAQAGINAVLLDTGDTFEEVLFDYCDLEHLPNADGD